MTNSPERRSPSPHLDDGMERTAITLVTIAVVALLAFLGACLPARSNEVPTWVRRLRHWANSCLLTFTRSFPDSLYGPLQRLSNYLVQFHQQGNRP